MNLSRMSQKLDFKFLVSIALTGAIVATFMLLGRVSAGDELSGQSHPIAFGYHIDPADVNGDGMVDVGDLRAVADLLDTEVPAGHPADVNGDGVVDAKDLAIVGATLGPEAFIEFLGARAQEASFNVLQAQLPDVNGTNTQGVKAHDRNGPTEPFLQSVAYLHLSSPQPQVAPYAMTSTDHSGFETLSIFGPRQLSFDLRASNMLANNVIHREFDAPMSLGDPLFDILDNVVYFIEERSGHRMEKRTYVGGEWSLINNSGTPNDASDDNTLATGTVEHINLFLDYTDFQNRGRGEVRVDPGTPFHAELVAGFGTDLLVMTIHSLQSPVFADNPINQIPPSQMYAVFEASVSLTPAVP